MLSSQYTKNWLQGGSAGQRRRDDPLPLEFQYTLSVTFFEDDIAFSSKIIKYFLLLGYRQLRKNFWVLLN
jgi:hypothetical protein